MSDAQPEWGKSVDGGTYLHVPFSEAFVDEFREFRDGVKGFDRFNAFRWEEPDERWWIRDDFVDDVELLLVGHFDGYE